MLENIMFEFYRGRTYSRDFSVSDWSFPISKIYFTVKEDIESKKHVLQKTLEDGITLVNEENGIRTYNLMICCTDTEHMKIDYDYVFDITIVSPGVDGDVIKQTICTGIVRLKGSATKPCNEC